MSRQRSLFAAACVWLAMATLAVAQTTVLQAIPENAGGFILINRLQGTSDKIQELTKLLNIPAPVPLATIQAMTGAQEGIDVEGNAAVVFLPPEGETGPPNTVLLVPVTDYSKFVKQLGAKDVKGDPTAINVLGQPMIVAKKDGFAALANAENENALQRVLKSKQGIAENVEPLRDYLLENEFSALITKSGVNRILQQAEKGLGEAQQGLEAADAEGAEEQIKAAGESLRQLRGVIEAAQGQISMVGLGARVGEKSSVHLTSRTVFEEGSNFAQAAKSIRQPEENLLAGLPSGPFVFAAGGVLPDQWSKELTALTVQMMKTNPMYQDLSPEEFEKLADVMSRIMENMNGMTMLARQGKPGDTLYSNLVGTVRVDDAQAFLKNYHDSLASLQGIFKDSKAFTDFTVQQTKIAGMPALEITMDMSAMLEQYPEGMRPLFEKMLGPEGKLTAYMAAVDKNTVAFAYVNPENLKAVAAAVKEPGGGLSADKQIAITREMLPENAQFVGYLSPRGVVGFIDRMIGTFAPPDQRPQIPEFPQTAPIGFGAGFTDNMLQTELVIPGDVLEAGGAYAQKTAQQLQPQQNPDIDAEEAEEAPRFQRRSR